MRFSTFAVPLISVALSAATALVISSGAANADGVATTDSVPRRISYSGRVEFSGVPYVGTLEMRFRLYDADRGETPIFSEEYTEAAGRVVAVHAGEFSVMLGQYAAGLQTAITAADSLTLGVEVRTPGDTEWVPLAGRQAITASPYAMWAIQGTDFSIARDGFVGRNLEVVGTSRLRGNTTLDGTLAASGAISTSSTLSATGALSTASTLSVTAASTLSGNATLGGTLSVSGAVTMANSLTVSRNIRAGAWTPAYASWDTLGTGDGGAAIYNSNGGDQALMIVGNTSGGGGIRRVKMWDDVTVNGSLRVLGASTTDGNARINGVLTFDGRSESGWDYFGDSSSTWGSTYEYTCPANQFVCGIRVRDEGSQGAGDDSGINEIWAKCCSLGS